MRILLATSGWSRHGGVWVKGGCFAEGSWLEGAALARYFAVADMAQFAQRLAGANGIFAVVVDDGSHLMAAIDGSRIYPLYYNSEALSDDPYQLVPSTPQLDSAALLWYRASGAVPSGSTLIRGVRQLQPWHCINLRSGSSICYYSYLARPAELRASSLQQLDQVMLRVFERMVASVAGRQIVVPLSGGYDSRLIVYMLSRLGYRNVVCYTVGSADSPECAAAQQIARLLQYPIHHIDTAQPQMLQYIREPQFVRYADFVGALTNFAWLFEYAAMRWLQDHDAVAPDAVAVPGHSLDFLGGSHVRKALVNARSGASVLAGTMLYDSFEHGYCPSLRAPLRAQFAADIRQGYTPWSAYQWAIMQHRLSHNINNSARAYEFLGYQLRLPYWDRELLDFFRVLPLDQLQHPLLCRYAEQHLAALGASLKPVESPKIYLQSKLRRRIKRFVPQFFYTRRKKISDPVGEYFLMQPLLSQLADSGCYPSSDNYQSVNKVLSDWYLHRIRQRFSLP